MSGITTETWPEMAESVENMHSSVWRDKAPYTFAKSLTVGTNGSN
jgi:hypothetical protein